MILDKRVNLKLQVVLSNQYTNCSSPALFIYSSSSSSSYKNHKQAVNNKKKHRAKELNGEKDLSQTTSPLSSSSSSSFTSDLDLSDSSSAPFPPSAFYIYKKSNSYYRNKILNRIIIKKKTSDLIKKHLFTNFLL
jgi:hypothetical protein